MNIIRKGKIIHILFLISVWIKGVAGSLETLAGILCFFVSPATIESLIISLTAPELSENPNDLIATTLRHAVRHYSADTALFAGVYLVIHGLIKIFLVAGLLAGKLWAYPLSLWFLGAFIVYQCYRYTHTHSVLLILLTVFDLAVVYLIWREYQMHKRIYVSHEV
jgi:uncharacterized membrane protein